MNNTGGIGYQMVVKETAGTVHIMVPELGLISSGESIYKVYQDLKGKVEQLAEKYSQVGMQLPPPSKGNIMNAVIKRQPEIKSFVKKSLVVLAVAVILVSVTTNRITRMSDKIASKVEQRLEKRATKLNSSFDKLYSDLQWITDPEYPISTERKHIIKARVKKINAFFSNLQALADEQDNND